MLRKFYRNNFNTGGRNPKTPWFWYGKTIEPILLFRAAIVDKFSRQTPARTPELAQNSLLSLSTSSKEISRLEFEANRGRSNAHIDISLNFNDTRAARARIYNVNSIPWSMHMSA